MTLTDSVYDCIEFVRARGMNCEFALFYRNIPMTVPEDPTKPTIVPDPWEAMIVNQSSFVSLGEADGKHTATGMTMAEAVTKLANVLRAEYADRAITPEPVTEAGESHKNKTAMVVLAAVDSDGESAGFGVMTADDWRRWQSEEIEEDISDEFGLMYGNSEYVDTYTSWDAVLQRVADRDGVISNVYACVAY